MIGDEPQSGMTGREERLQLQPRALGLKAGDAGLNLESRLIQDLDKTRAEVEQAWGDHMSNQWELVSQDGPLAREP
jgi:hypothetical protein